MENETFVLDDYNDLLHQHEIQKKELNEAKQNLHEVSRQLKINEALLVEYQNDIELLQRSENSNKEKLEGKVASLEETIASLRSSHFDDICYLESKLERKENENEDLKSQIELLEKKNVVEATNDVSMNLSEISRLTKENELLQEKVQEMADVIEHLRNQNNTLEETLEQHKEEISQLKEISNLKRQELSENASIINKLNDELMCANIELENYKHKPLAADSKGNSLFAEVDDRRVHLQETINHMKSTYIRLKQEHSQQLKLISHLRKENANVRESWKKDLEEMQEDKYWVNDTLKRHVKVLEEIIEDQKKQLEEESEKPEENLSGGYQYYQQIIDDKSKEIAHWKKRNSDMSINEHLLSINLAEANKKVRVLRVELQQQIDEMNEIKSQNKIENDEFLCIKCKISEKDRRKSKRFEIEKEHKTFEVPERKPIKSCLKPERKTLSDNDMTLDFNITEDHTKNEGDFKIFHNDITLRRKTSTLPTSDINNPKRSVTRELSSDNTDLISFEDKENLSSNIDTSVREKRGVSFTANTVDPVGNPVRKRNTRIFVMNQNNVNDVKLDQE